MTREGLFKLWKKQHEKYLQRARETLEKNRARYKRQQDAQIIKTQTIFNIGDKVLLRNDHKKKQTRLRMDWISKNYPSKSSQLYITKFLDSRESKVHDNRLKLY